MIKKLMILGSVYYSLIILSACCKPYTYFWNYEKLSFEFDEIYSNVDVEILPSENFMPSSDLIVTNFNFKSLNATSCPEKEYYLEYKIKNILISTDKKLSDNLLSNKDISQVIKFNNKNGVEESDKEDLINSLNQTQYYEYYIPNTKFSFKLDLNTPDLDTISKFTFTIKLELTNDEIIVDSIQNIRVNDFKPNPEYEFLWE